MANSKVTEISSRFNHVQRVRKINIGGTVAGCKIIKIHSRVDSDEDIVKKRIGELLLKAMDKKPQPGESEVLKKVRSLLECAVPRQ